jgi:hypothetical protein
VVSPIPLLGRGLKITDDAVSLPFEIEDCAVASIGKLRTARVIRKDGKIELSLDGATFKYLGDRDSPD